LGVKAVEILLEKNVDQEPLLVGVLENEFTVTPLRICLEKTAETAKLIAAKEFDKAAHSRDHLFSDAFRIQRILNKVEPKVPVGFKVLFILK
jgi:hypothetical protein